MRSSKRFWVSVLVGVVAFLAPLVFGDEGSVAPVVFGLMAAGLTYLQLWSWAVRDRRRQRRRSG